MAKFNLIAGALFGLLAVVAGAVGDHKVKEILDEEFKARGEAAAALENRVGGNQAIPTDEDQPTAEPPVAEDEPTADGESAEEEASSVEGESTTENSTDEEDTSSAEEARNAALPTEVPSPPRPNYAAEREERMSTFQIGTRYQMYHALAMVALGAMLLSSSRGALTGLLAGLLFTLGQVLFCGCLYLISIYDMQELTWLVPFGGTSFIAGWALFLLAAVQVQPHDDND